MAKVNLNTNRELKNLTSFFPTEHTSFLSSLEEDLTKIDIEHIEEMCKMSGLSFDLENRTVSKFGKKVKI